MQTLQETLGYHGVQTGSLASGGRWGPLKRGGTRRGREQEAAQRLSGPHITFTTYMCFVLGVFFNVVRSVRRRVTWQGCGTESDMWETEEAGCPGQRRGQAQVKCRPKVWIGRDRGNAPDLEPAGPGDERCVGGRAGQGQAASP